MSQHSAPWGPRPTSAVSASHFENDYDVLIIGGGITGLTAAWLLTQAGRRVCLLEEREFASGETGHTSAHLASLPDVDLRTLIRQFGVEPARDIVDGHSTAITQIETCVNQLSIDCDFQRVPGFRIQSLGAESQSHVEERALRDELEAGRKLGLPVSWRDTVPGLNRYAVELSQQGRFDPVRYAAALVDALRKSSCQLVNNVAGIEFSRDPRGVVLDGRVIRAELLFIATHVPVQGIANAMQTAALQSRLFPYSSYVIAGLAPSGRAPEGLYWDLDEPYNYLRIDRGAERDRWIFGGADHKTGQHAADDQPWKTLNDRAEQIAPGFTREHHWSGQVIETTDGLPYIGELCPGQFIATGYSGNGLTYGTLAAIMSVDHYLGRTNRWAKLFDPHRVSLLAGGPTYVRENMDYPYYLVRDWVVEGKREIGRAIAPGEGQILLHHGERVACSRGGNGELHAVSAVCTHMGCLVRWNKLEQTWDCPCHGSRFTSDGQVMGGPAEAPLKPVDVAGLKLAPTSAAAQH